MDKTINVAELQVRFSEYPGLAKFVAFLGENLIIRPWDSRFTQLLNEMDDLSRGKNGKR